MLGAILLDMIQESKLASWTMEVLSLMPERGDADQRTDRDSRTRQIDETVGSPNQVLNIGRDAQERQVAERAR